MKSSPIPLLLVCVCLLPQDSHRAQIKELDEPLGLHQPEEAVPSPDRAAAIQKLTEEVKSATDAHSTDIAAGALNRIGVLYVQSRDFPSALAAFHQCLELYRQAGDSSAESQVLTRIGKCHQALRQYHKALDHFLLALHIRRRIGDKSGEASSLSDIGNTYRLWGYPKEALPHINAALARCVAIQECPERAKILNETGLTYFDLRDYKRALGFYQRALPLFRAKENELIVAIVLYNIGAANNKIGHFSDAIPWLAEATSRAQRMGSDELVAKSQLDIGFSHAGLQETKEAVESYREALASFRRLGMKEREADVLNRLDLLEARSRH